jgi:EmrB/QacA subfamily drug resistance transporter
MERDKVSFSDAEAQPRFTEAGQAGSAGDPRRWLALVVLMTAGFMDLLDTTIVNVAVPSIERHLHASSSQVQWVIVGYSLAFALTLITGGRLGDIAGRKRMFLIGVAGFTASSAIAGASTTAGLLIAARALEGASAAVMTTQVLSIIQAIFPARERAAVFGLYGGVSGLAAVSGPLIGGALVNANLFGWGWRPVFLINVPIGLLALLAAARVVRESKSGRPLRLDVIGVALVTAAMLLLIYPLIQGQQDGWPIWSIAMLAASVPTFAIFVAYERHKTVLDGSPLVVLHLFRQRAFVAGILIQAAYYAGTGSLFIVFTLDVQAGLGFSALHAGLTVLPFSLGAMVAAGASVPLGPRLGRALIVAGGAASMIGCAGTLWAAHHYGVHLSSLDLTAPFAVSGIGLGLMLPPLVNVTLAGVDPANAGSASGVLNTMQQSGQAIGVALIGLVFFHLLGHIPSAHSYTHAFTNSLWIAIGAFTLSTIAAFLLPAASAALDPGRTAPPSDGESAAGQGAAAA